MRTCYLHLGMPKTGSTAIQQSFYGYQGESIEYARLRRSNHGAAIISYFTQKPENTRPFRFLGAKRTDEFLKKNRRAFEKSIRTKKSVVFSGERIARQLKPNEFANMVKFFKERFDRIEVIAYVRPISSLVNSQFQQQVKGGGKRQFELPPPDYKGFFKPILDNIESENLQLIRYDRKDLVGGDIVEDFAKRIGAKDFLQHKDDVNESLSAEAVGALYAFNKYSGHILSPRQHQRVLVEMHKALQGVGKVKFGLSTELIEAHIHTHAAEVAWMEDIAGFDLKGEIKEVPEPVGSEEDLLRLADQADQLLAMQKKNRSAPIKSKTH